MLRTVFSFNISIVIKVSIFDLITTMELYLCSDEIRTPNSVQHILVFDNDDDDDDDDDNNENKIKIIRIIIMIIIITIWDIIE